MENGVGKKKDTSKHETHDMGSLVIEVLLACMILGV